MDRCNDKTLRYSTFRGLICSSKIILQSKLERMFKLEAICDYMPQRLTELETINNNELHGYGFQFTLNYMKNIDTGVIHRHDGEIRIGEYCWINAGTIVTKNTILPAHTIVARNSFVNKDYSPLGEYRIITGIPAKVHDGHVQRIFNLDIEQAYDRIFS